MGVQRNYRTAFDYLLEAAQYEEPSAQKYVATLYLDGAGVLQSYGDAYMCAYVRRHCCRERQRRSDPGSKRCASPRDLGGGRASTCESRRMGRGWKLGQLFLSNGTRARLGGETWTVDFDRWRVRWDTSGEYDDVKIDGDEISIQELSGRVTAVINMKSLKYEARAIDVSAVVDIYYSKFGTCVISNK
jgi:hypothetical protein